jgi:SPP1 family predicted phage head-tail adaptor
MNISHFYNDVVTLYTVTESVSTLTGENLKTNSTGVSVKCKIRPLTNYEKYMQNKNNVEMTHRIYASCSTFWENVNRILYGSVQYEIVGIINPFNKNDFYQIDVKAVK